MARQTDVARDDGSASVTRIDASVYETPAHDAAAARIVIPDTELLFSARFKKVGGDLILTGEDGAKFVVVGYFNQTKLPDLAAPGGAFLSGDLIERLAVPETPGQYAQVGAPAGAPVIGRVERLGGSATVQHANGVIEELTIGAVIRQGDVIETRDSSTLGISFVDGTAFNMGASARMLVSELIYDASSASNSAVFSLVKGAISFVAGQAAKTGDMRVETPIATVGIRGTSVNTNIITDVNGQAVSATYSLMQDPDGRIGAFNIINRLTGDIIASVTTTDNVFMVTPTATGVDALSNPKTAQDIAQELSVAQALFPIFLSNPANFAPQPQPPNPTPQTPSSPGSSTPPNDVLPPPQPQPPLPIQTPDNRGGLETGNGQSAGNSGGGNGGGNNNPPGGSSSPPPVDVPPPDPVVIPGTNGQPTITPDTASSHALGENPNTSGSSAPSTLSGTLTFADADANDTHIAGAVLVSGGAVWSGGDDIPFASLLAFGIAAMSVMVTADSTHAGSGNLTWTFNLPDQYFDFLGEGETLELTYAVGVQDSSGASNNTSTAQLVKIIITGTNDTPVLSVAEPAVSLTEGGTVDIAGVHVSDPDINDVLTVTLHTDHGVISLAGSGDGSLSIEYLDDGSIRIVGSAAAIDAVIAAGVHYTPSDGFVGNDSLSIEVSDGHGGTQSQSVKIDVLSGPGRPQTNAAEASIDENATSSVTIHLTGNDTDGSVVAFRIVDIGSLHGALYDSFGNLLSADSLITASSGGTFSVYFVPDPNFSGDATFTFAARDNDGQEDVSPATATITVNPVNDAPVLAAEIADQSTLEDKPWSFQVPAGTFTDVDSALNYTATLADGDPLPAWLSFDAQTHTFSGTPPANFNGSVELKVTATDGEYSVSDTFTVEIAPVNDVPVVANAIPDRVSEANTPWVFHLAADTFADVDSTLSYTATLANGAPLPSWLTFDAQTQTFSGTPPGGLHAAIELKVTASDGEYSVSDTFTVEIVPVNNAPILSTPVADQSTVEDASWTFQVPAGTFTDIDSTLTYSAMLANGDPLPTWLTFDAQTQTFSGTPPQDFNGSLDLTVTADDGQYSVSDTFSVDVTPVNDAPAVVHSISDQLSPEDTPWTFQVPADTFDDVDSATLTYDAMLANGDPLPSWLTFNAQTQTFSGTPPQGFSGQLDLKVTATDGEYSAHDVFTLNVSSGNQAPVVVSQPNPPDHLVEDSDVAQESVVLVSASDSPGDAVHYDMTGWTLAVPAALGATEFNGHYYLFVNASLNWTQAQANAQSLGGYLVNITSEEENTFVNSLKGGTSAWIGATDAAEEGTWVWTGGPEANQQFWQGAGPGQGGYALGYNHWWGDEPNGSTSENYAFIDQNGVWTDASASNFAPQGFIVEFSDLTLWQRAGAYGTAYFDTASGALVYVLDNDSDAVQSLNTGDQVTESFDIVAADQAGASDSTTVTFTIDGADEVNNPPDTYDRELNGDEDTAISVSLYGYDPDGSVAGFRIMDTANLNGTLYRDGSLTEVLHEGDIVNASSGGSATIYFVPTTDFSDTTQFSVAAIDNDNAEDPSPGVVTIHVEAVNEAPVVDLDTQTAGNGHETSVVTTSGEEVFISAAPSITDSDNTHLQGLTITLIDGEDGDQLISGDNPNLPGLDWEYFGTAGDPGNPLRIVFTGDAPLSVYQLAIEQISFSTISPIGGDRHIEIVVSDGVSESEPVTSTVTVVGAANFQVTTQTGYDASTFYDAINDSVVTTGYDGSGFLAVGETLPYAFRVHGHDFTYSGSADHPDLDSGIITSIEILTNALDPLAEATGLHITISDLEAALTQYNASNGANTSLLDAIFRGMPSVATGDAGPDVLIGGSLVDTLQGGDGDDILKGGDSNDTLDGGGGLDRADYSDADGAVTIRLGTGQAFGSGVGSDTLISIEGAIGSDFNDTYDATNYTPVGAPTPAFHRVINVFEGGKGDDVIIGNDLIHYPGSGTVASYRHATGSVTVNLTTGADGDASVGHDTFTNVHSVMGSDFADILTGTSDANVVEQFWGGGGDDFIDGKGGFFSIVYYDDESTAISVNLATGIVTGGDGGPNGDTLRSVEQIRGTKFADTYTANGFGSAGALNVGTLGAYNAFEGFGGDDIITGNGSTRVLYLAALAGVTVDLQAGTGQGTDSGDIAGVGHDTFITGVNAVGGSAFDDVLLGSANNDTLQGRGGDDLLDGRGGAFDQADYNHPNDLAGIHVDMGAGIVVGDDYNGTDTLRSIETVRGTDWDDIYDASTYGTENALNKGDNGTFNRFEGDLGNDTIIGNGNTQVAFFSATGAVAIVLGAGGAGSASDISGGNSFVGNDTFVSGVNTAVGSNFNDTYNAAAFNAGLFNQFEGRAGNDSIVGNGRTQMVYFSATGGVTVNMITGVADGDGSVGHDTFSGVNDVVGSNFNDTIVAAVNDVRDFFNGGNGTDTADYSNYVTALTVTLSGATSAVVVGSGTAAATSDQIQNIENFYGGSGNDIITGDSGNNILRGNGGNDQLFGGDGNDILGGGGGADELHGGGGSDIASYQNATAAVIADLLTSSNNTGSAAGDTYDSIESLRGTAFADQLFGDDGNNSLDGFGGADHLDGRGGFDFARYTSATAGLTVSLLNQAANTGDAAGDTYVNIEGLWGSSFNDTLIGDNNINLLDGAGGADTLDGQGGLDYARYTSSASGLTASLASPSQNTGDAIGDVYISIEGLIGSSFNDVLIGDNNNNILRGDAGADALIGGDGFDTADYSQSASGLVVDMLNLGNNSGDAAGDTYTSIEIIRGSTFNDTLRADNSGRILEGGLGQDVLVGGSGFDTAAYWNAASGVTVSLGDPSQNTGEAQGDTYSSIENLIGSNFADTLIGDGNNNHLRGGLGSDVLNGGGGFDTADYIDSGFFPSEVGVTADLANSANNTGTAAGDSYISIENLTGSQFDDRLHGNAANNILTGSSGNDTFVFNLGDGHDTVADFARGQDKIDLTVGLDQAGLQALLTASPNSDTLTFSDGSSITFTGLTLNQLNAQNDFVLH